MEFITQISNFVLVSMCVGYIPTFIYMFTKRDLEGGYGQKINACELFKWTAIFYAVNLVLEVLINGLAPLPIFAAATADLSSVNLLATEGNLWMCLLTTGILAPIAEEISLRFMVQKGMTRAGEKFAIFWSALIFGILHMNLFQSTYAFLMGLLICFIYYKTNYNLWYTTIIHVVNNSFAVLISQTGVNAYVAYTVLPIVFFGVYYILNQKNKSIAEATAYLKANYSAQLN
jgi:membrane protease YdiL (CAAX protease family)